MAVKKVNVEKIGVYIAAAMAFWTILNSITGSSRENKGSGD